MTENPFLDDLRGMCRAALGSSWTDKPAASMDALKQILWLPKEFLTLYETIGSEPVLLFQNDKGGFFPAEKVHMDPKKGRFGPFFIYYQTGYRDCWGKFSYAADHYPENNGIFVWRSSINGWEQMYAYESVHTLCDVLLSHAGEQLTARMPNCAWVKVPLGRGEDPDLFLTAAQRLDMTPSKSISYRHYGYAYDVERGLLLQYNDDLQKRCMVYSIKSSSLEEIGEKYPIIWQKRDGEKILDPKTFLQDPPPASFGEKLEMLSVILLGKRSMSLPAEAVEKAEQRLGVVFPEALREFYLRFGKGGKLFSESLHFIYTPDKLESNGDRLILADENQYVWRWCLNTATGEIDLDLGNGQWRKWELNLEDTVIWLLASQATEFLSHGGRTMTDLDDESRELFAHYFYFLSEKVIANPKRGLVGIQDEDDFYIMARSAAALEKLETDSGIAVGEF
jgi:hypothetical protein